MKNLNDLFLDELMDVYDAEHRITKALPKMIKAATCSDLQNALQTHLEETKGHITKVEEVFAMFEEKAKAKKCEATVGLLKEGDEMAGDYKDSSAINAAIIAACQKVEHYEMATYGSLRDWAKLLGKPEAAEVLQEILDEEKNADKKLTQLAPEKNQEALSDEDSDQEESRNRLQSKSARTYVPATGARNGADANAEEDSDNNARGDRKVLNRTGSALRNRASSAKATRR